MTPESFVDAKPISRAIGADLSAIPLLLYSQMNLNGSMSAATAAMSIGCVRWAKGLPHGMRRSYSYALDRVRFVRYFGRAVALVLLGMALGMAPSPGSLYGQALSVSGAAGAPGAAINLTVSLGSSTPAASIQWDLNYSPADLALASGSFFSTGAAASNAGKTAACASISAGNVRCIISGTNITQFAAGAMATLAFTIVANTSDSSTTVSLANTSGADAHANGISIAAGSGLVSISQPTQMATTTSLATSPLTMGVTDTGLVTATVKAASGSNPPDGTVAFSLGFIPLGTVSLSGAGTTSTAALPLLGSLLALGSNRITATYSGSSSFGSSSGSTSLTILTVAPVSVAPASGQGTSQTFTLKYSDTAGAVSLQSTGVWFDGSTSNNAGSCQLSYTLVGKQVSLFNDAGTAVVSGPVGAATTLQNNQCSLNLANVTASKNGNNLTLTLPMTFQPGYLRARNVYMNAIDTSGVTSGWQQAGAWQMGSQASTGGSKIGIFRQGAWIVNTTGTGAYSALDGAFAYGGLPGDIPVFGDWNGDGKTKIGIYRSGTWILDTNGNGAWDPSDAVLLYGGLPGDIPVVGDWNGSGTSKIGIYRSGTWILDTNGNGAWDPTDAVYTFGGLASDVPVVGDWNGSGTSKMGIYRQGTWILDSNGSNQYNASDIQCVYGGLPTDIPVVGKWGGSSKSLIGVYRNGTWLMDSNGNYAWDASDSVFNYGGVAGDLPVVGNW